MERCLSNSTSWDNKQMKSRQRVMQHPRLMLALPTKQHVHKLLVMVTNPWDICCQLLFSVTISTLGINWNYYLRKCVIQGSKKIMYVNDIYASKKVLTLPIIKTKAFDMLSHLKPFSVIVFNLESCPKLILYDNLRMKLAPLKNAHWSSQFKEYKHL